MATVALAAGGSALFGLPGQIIGGALGSYLDTSIIFPFLFPPEDEGGKVLELQIHGVDEGHPMLRFYGPRGRGAGTIIWSSNTIKETKVEAEGAKGGPQEAGSFDYSVDLLIAWGEGPPDGLGVAAVDRIYAGVDLIYDETPNVNLSGTDITATIVSTYRWTWTVPEQYVVSQRFLVLTAPADGTDLSTIRSGVDVVVAGFTETDYNGTFRCVAAMVQPGDSTLATFDILTTASDAGEAAGNTITLDQTNVKFDPNVIGSITNFLGTETQTLAGSIVEAQEGTGQVPGYRSRILTLIDDLKISAPQFGNRIPNFGTEVHVDATDDLEDVMDDILSISDLTSAQYDVTALAGTACGGFVARGPQPTVSTLQPLLITFDVISRESNGVITFFKRANATTKIIAVDDLVAHEELSEAPRPHELRDEDKQNPPSQVHVKYPDSENNLQPGEQIERRRKLVSTFQKQAVEVAITMDGGQARDLAAKLLWTAWTGSREIEIQIPPSYLDLQENDIAQYVYLGETYRLLVQEINEGENGIRVVRGREELAANLTHNSPHEAPFGKPGNQKLYVPYDCNIQIIDTVALRSTDVNVPGIYIALSSRDASQIWRGATIYVSDDGTNFTAEQFVEIQSTMGASETLLGAGTGEGQWDLGSTLRVKLDSGSLTSRTEIDVLNGANRAFAGEEMIGYQTATLVSNTDRTYDLTKLLRGLGGTEDFMGNHIIGDRFIWLNSPGITFIPLTIADLGVTKHFKAISPGGTVADFVAIQAVIQLNNLKPWFVADLTGVLEI